MDWLTSFGSGQVFRYADLASFEFEGRRVPLTDRGRGIRRPAQLEAALSISTVYTAPQQVPPYEDQEGRDGLLRYKFRGEDPRHPENVALRNALQRRLPLIWFVGVGPGSYLPTYPVYLVDEEPTQYQFVVALDPAQRHLLRDRGVKPTADDRRYSATITRQRLHQPLFRARVLEAYERQCAMCRLRHVSLLDASHIVQDGEPLGQPVVPNGLSLCKIHHAAYDQNILAVSPDLRIGVRRDILAEIDGPMLKHGLQALAGESIAVPRQRVARPDRERLELRYRAFTDAA